MRLEIETDTSPSHSICAVKRLKQLMTACCVKPQCEVREMRGKSSPKATVKKRASKNQSLTIGSPSSGKKRKLKGETGKCNSLKGHMYHESILLYTIASGPPLLAARVVSSEIHSSGSSLGKPAMKQGRLVRRSTVTVYIWIYRIAGNFRGAKFSWLNTGPRIFYPRMKRPYHSYLPLPAVQAATTNWQYFDPRKLPAIRYIIWVTNGGSHTHHIRPHTGLIALRLIWWVLTRRVVQQ